MGKDSDNDMIEQAEGMQDIDLKLSDLLKGNFAPIEIPYIEIPGSAPLVYNETQELLEQINEKDVFADFDLAEEFLMFTAEVEDLEIRKEDGPH